MYNTSSLHQFSRMVAMGHCLGLGFQSVSVRFCYSRTPAFDKKGPAGLWNTTSVRNLGMLVLQAAMESSGRDIMILLELVDFPLLVLVSVPPNPRPVACPCPLYQPVYLHSNSLRRGKKGVWGACHRWGEGLASNGLLPLSTRLFFSSTSRHTPTLVYGTAHVPATSGTTH